jgi:hypothetical protein
MRPEEDSNSFGNYSSDDLPPSQLKRPVGTKKAKKLQRSKACDGDEDIIEIQRYYVAEAKRRHDLIEEQNRFALFTVAPLIFHNHICKIMHVFMIWFNRLVFQILAGFLTIVKRFCSTPKVRSTSYGILLEASRNVFWLRLEHRE